MEYSHRYSVYPTQEVAGELEHHIDIHRQAYNYTLYEYDNVDADSIGSAYKHHHRLPDWKDAFPVPSSRRSTQRLYRRSRRVPRGLTPRRFTGPGTAWYQTRDIDSLVELLASRLPDESADISVGE